MDKLSCDICKKFLISFKHAELYKYCEDDTKEIILKILKLCEKCFKEVCCDVDGCCSIIKNNPQFEQYEPKKDFNTFVDKCNDCEELTCNKHLYYGSNWNRCHICCERKGFPYRSSCDESESSY